jgi:hypothetical protein
LLLCHGATAAGSTTLAGAYTLDWTADSTFVYFTLTLQSDAWYVGASRAVRGWREVTRHWRGVAWRAADHGRACVCVCVFVCLCVCACVCVCARVL